MLSFDRRILSERQRRWIILRDRQRPPFIHAHGERNGHRGSLRGSRRRRCDYHHYHQHHHYHNQHIELKKLLIFAGKIIAILGLMVMLTRLQTPSTCVGTAEDALCPFTPEQVRKGSDDRFYFISCTNRVGGSSTNLGNLVVSSTNAIGQCISLCIAFNADPANAARPRCDYGQIVAGQTITIYCTLWANVNYQGGPDAGVAGNNANKASFIVTGNQDVIVRACPIPNQISSSSSDTLLTVTSTTVTTSTTTTL